LTLSRVFKIPYDCDPLYRHQTVRWTKKTDPAVLQSLIDVISATIEAGFIKVSLAAHGVDDKLSLLEHTG
jgi:hypothetical protein